MIFLSRLLDKILLFFGNVKINIINIIIRPRYYLPKFYINYRKVFELVVTGNNTKNTKNIAIQRKYKKNAALS